jgi:hypothetical protein
MEHFADLFLSAQNSKKYTSCATGYSSTYRPSFIASISSDNHKGVVFLFNLGL